MGRTYADARTALYVDYLLFSQLARWAWSKRPVLRR